MAGYWSFEYLIEFKYLDNTPADMETVLLENGVTDVEIWKKADEMAGKEKIALSVVKRVVVSVEVPRPVSQEAPPERNI